MSALRPDEAGSHPPSACQAGSLIATHITDHMRQQASRPAILSQRWEDQVIRNTSHKDHQDQAQSRGSGGKVSMKAHGRAEGNSTCIIWKRAERAETEMRIQLLAFISCSLVKDRRDGQARSYHDIVGLLGTMVSGLIACNGCFGIEDLW